MRISSVVLRLVSGALWLSVWQGAAGQAASNTSLNAQLLVAARQSDLAAVAQALDRGAAPNSRNRLGKTVLQIGRAHV